MAEPTSIRGWVMNWADDAPRTTLPVRCLEEELLPQVAPLPPTAPPSLEGRQRATTIAAKRGAGSGATLCEACGTYAAVEGTRRCHRPICSPAGKTKSRPPPRVPASRLCRGCSRARAPEGSQWCGGRPCQAMRARIEQLAGEEHGP